MEEILPEYNLKIYIDNVFCDPIEDVSCPRSIIISYKWEVVTLINHNLFGTAQLEVQQHMLILKFSFMFLKPPRLRGLLLSVEINFLNI